MSEGRLLDAVQSVRELRTVLTELTAEAKAAEAAEAAAAELAAKRRAEEAAAEAAAARERAATAPAAVPAEAPGPASGTTPTGPGPRRRVPLPTHDREWSATEPGPRGSPGPRAAPGQAPARGPSTPAPSSKTDPEAEERELLALMQKARSLAAKVRSLPPGSPEAKFAAAQLREATKLLKTRQLNAASASLGGPAADGTAGGPGSVPPGRGGDTGRMEVPEGFAPGIASGEGPELAALSQKARDLAAWVRTLPPDSEESQTASREIHEATELLIRHRLTEADVALTRIMDSLAQRMARK